MEKKNFKIKDKNTIFTGFCLTIAFILTIVLSFGVSFYFRPINDSTFWGNLLVALALCIYTLYFGISESLNYYRKKDGGRLYHSYIEPIFNHNAQMQNRYYFRKLLPI